MSAHCKKVVIALFFIVACSSVVKAEDTVIDREELHIKVQNICPVSGLELGAHGPPVKVVVGEDKEEVYLCCKACMQRQIDPDHWATIHQNIATAAANLSCHETSITCKSIVANYSRSSCFCLLSSLFRKDRRGPR